MLNQMLMEGIMGLSLSFVSALGFSASIEGYWKSIEERTGEQLSIVEIRKGNDGRYHGKIVYRYPNSHGIALTNCSKCQKETPFFCLIVMIYSKKINYLKLIKFLKKIKKLILFRIHH